MCIFTSSINSVSSTRIFARLDGARQAIVYDMYLSSASDTAMVLPIPISKNPLATVEFVDLSGYESFFDDVDDLFPKLRSPGPIAASVEDLEYIEVEKVGSFSRREEANCAVNGR